MEFAIPGAPTETIDVKILNATSEDEEQRQEFGLLSHANVYAGTLVGGPLLNMLTAGEATEVRLMNAIDALSETQTPESEAVGDEVLELLN